MKHRGDEYLACARGPEGTTGFVLYEIAGGALKGAWFPPAGAEGQDDMEYEDLGGRPRARAS